MGLATNEAMLQKTLFFTQNVFFFSKALTKFSKRPMTMFKLSKRSVRYSSLRRKNNQEHTTRQTDYNAGNVKKKMDF